jgi:hypothetical protein
VFWNTDHCKGKATKKQEGVGRVLCPSPFWLKSRHEVPRRRVLFLYQEKENIFTTGDGVFDGKMSLFVQGR